MMAAIQMRQHRKIMTIETTTEGTMMVMGTPSSAPSSAVRKGSLSSNTFNMFVPTDTYEKQYTDVHCALQIY